MLLIRKSNLTQHLETHCPFLGIVKVESEIEEKQAVMEKAKVLPFWPRWDGASEESVPSDIIGATILAIGSIQRDCQKWVEGGLVIDYKTPQGEVRRLVLNFNDQELYVGLQGKPILGAGR